MVRESQPRLVLAAFTTLCFCMAILGVCDLTAGETWKPHITRGDGVFTRRRVLELIVMFESVSKGQSERRNIQ